MSTATATEPVFKIARVLNAPVERVYAAHTDENELKQWFGPKGFTMPRCFLDLSLGGLFHYCLKTPDGQEMWGKWTFRQIVEPERLVVVVSFSDEDAGVTRHPWNADWPLQTLGDTTFEAQGDKTLMTVRWSPFEPTAKERETFASNFASMQQGWSGTLDQLETYLAKR